MATPSPPSGGPVDNRAQVEGNLTPQRRIPSFKLMEDDHVRPKRLRNRVPGLDETEDAREDPMATAMFEDVVAINDRAGPRQIPSLTFSSDVVRGMSHASSWGSGTGGNCFGLDPTSVDGEVEDVRRLDDAAFADLNFFTMEDVGPSVLPFKQKEVVEGQESSVEDNNTVTRIDQGGDTSPCRGSATIQSTVRKSGTLAATSVCKIESAREMPSVGTDRRTDDTADILGPSVFDPDGRLPTFSASMEEYLNRQLEAAEESLHGRKDNEGRPTSSLSSGGGGGGGGETTEDFSTRIQAASEGDTPFSLDPTTMVNKAEYAIPMNPEVSLNDVFSAYGSVKEDGFVQSQAEKGTSDEEGTLTQLNGEEEAASSDSEYEPAPQQKEKLKKGRRGRGRGRGAARAAKRSIGDEDGPENLSNIAVPRGTAKRQTSEDVAARLPLEMLECFYHVPLNIAARQLNVSLTMLKKLCRAYGVKRWPHRQVSSLDKAISRLEEKINARKDGGKDAPSLRRKLAQGKKRRSVIIKTASAGLEVGVLNSIFTCRPGQIDEDMLLNSPDVAKVLKNIKPSLQSSPKDSGSEDEDDEYDGDDGGGYASSVSLSSSPKKTRIGSEAKTSFSYNQTGLPHPPAFEPGGYTSGVAKKGDTKPGKEPSAKAESLMLTTRIKGEPSAAVDSQKAAKPAWTYRASDSASKLPSAAAASSSPSRPYRFEGSTGGSTTSANDESSPGCLSPAFTFAGSPGSRAPITTYSGVFGMSLNSPTISGREKGPTVPITKGTGIEISGGIPSGQVQAEVVPPLQGMRVPGWCGAGGKRAVGFGEWCGATLSPQMSPSPQHLSDTPPDSPTISSTLDNFNSKLRLESPPRGQPFSSAPPPPPPPHGHHTYLLQQQFPHQANFHHHNWLQGHYPGPSQPYGFPLEVTSPADTRLVPDQGKIRNFHAFSTVDDKGDVNANSPVAAGSIAGDGIPKSGWGGSIHSENRGTVGMGAAQGALTSTGKVTATKNGANPNPTEKAGDPNTGGVGPRRTGFMSFLLHQSPNSPPFATSFPTADI